MCVCVLWVFVCSGPHLQYMCCSVLFDFFLLTFYVFFSIDLPVGMVRFTATSTPGQEHCMTIYTKMKVIKNL